jgi:hypothetical protein
MNHFELNRLAFEEARVASPDQEHECCFCIAGKNVYLNIIGDSLFYMVEAAFSHLLIPTLSSDSADLNVRLWDTYETGIASPLDPPDTPCSLNGHISRSDDGICISHYRQQIYCTLDRNQKSIIGVCKGARHMSLFDQGKPLHALIGIWLADIGMPFLHGGAVVGQGQGILLGGSGGSGKSTTALACLDAGWDYLGDDAIAIEQTAANRFVAHSVYATTTLAPDHMRNFTRLTPYAIPGTNPGEDKDLVVLSRLYPGQLKRSAVIQALVIPTVTNKPVSKIRLIRKIDALMALAPSSVLYLPNAGASYLNLLGSITQSVPCYGLELGADIAQISEHMSTILNPPRLL